MIAVIDYGVGNLFSLKSSFAAIGREAIVTGDPETIRRASIAMYEGEINMVIHADGGTITVEFSPEFILIVLADKGPGIKDINLAMSEGYSTASENVRSLVFGAGMGLPNMKRYTDDMKIESQVGVGTTITMRVNII